MYKLFIVQHSTEANSIIRLSDNVSIPLDPDNTDYQQFVDDIYTNGIGIVEGADYVGVTTYTEARKAEYPPLEEQLDKIEERVSNIESVLEIEPEEEEDLEDEDESEDDK